MYLNQLPETTSIANDPVPQYRTPKAVADSQTPAPDATSVLQFVINLEDEEGREFYLNGQNELSPLTVSQASSPKLIDTVGLQPVFEASRADYASTFLVYALTLDEFNQRRSQLNT